MAEKRAQEQRYQYMLATGTFEEVAKAIHKHAREDYRLTSVSVIGENIRGWQKQVFYMVVMEKEATA